MKTRIILWCASLFAVIFANAQGTKITLQQSIESALKNNVLTRQGELEMRTAELNYRQAKNNRLPRVQGAYDYGFNNGRSIDPFTNGYINQNLTSSNVNAQGSLPIFSGFQLKNTIRQNELAFQTATMQWQQAKDELTLNVILAYLQILNNEDALVLAKQQADVSRQQVERLQIMANEGATPPANLSDLRGQYAGDKLSIISAENNLSSSSLALTRLMNIAYDSTLVLDRSGFSDKINMYGAVPDEIYAMALQKLASVKASELQVKTSAMAVKVAGSAAFPALSIYGVLNTNFSSAAMLNRNLGFTEVPNGDYVVVNGTNVPVYTKQGNYASEKIRYGTQLNNNLSTGYGLSLSIPLFNSFRNRTNVKLARNIQQNDQLIADNIKFQLRQAVDQAFVNITTTYKRYTVLQEQLAAYAESFRIANIRFENGVINSPEYLIAKNNLDRTNANLITTRYEYLLRTKVLDFYMGRLTW
jgi:outer membrane protein